MTDFVIILVLVVILGGALWYMKKEKKKGKGVTCIGCPDADVCAKRKNGETCL
ncbi:MAG: FeoB-associated Cys-rich membrane protein [Agathobacter sp.]|nr:FeoB-associated Cys-rich membrane protein [Agathobacter sp.]